MMIKSEIARSPVPHLRRFAYFFVLLTVLAVGLVLSPAASFKQSAAVISLTLSGNVQADGANLPNAVVSLTGSQMQRTITDSNGNYTLTTNAGGNYTITASKNGFVFNPASQTVTNLQSNQTVNFVSSTTLCAPPPAELVGSNQDESNLTDSSGAGNNSEFFNNTFSTGKVGQAMLGNCTTGAVVTEGNSLDISFGNGGKVTTQIGSSFAYANAIAIQPDNKIVAAGYDSNGANNDFALARYNADGSLDTSFGAGGKVSTAIGGSYEIATSIVIETDNKIIAAGYTYNGINEDFALVRYNSNGSLDNSFGTGGKVVTAFGNANDEAYSVTLQSDGKIVAGGYSYNGTNNDFALVRYNADGSLDSTFGTGGRVTMPFGNGTDIIRAVAIQKDGKIIAAGYFFNIGNNDFAIARYNTDGSLDTTYGTNGKVVTAIGNSTDEIFSIAFQPNGKLVVAGCSNNGSNNDFALARYNADGSLDTSFGAGGKVTTPFFNSFDIPYSVALQADGKIVAAGFARNTANEDFALARYNTDGSLDNSFGTGGKVTTQFENSFEIAYAVAIQADGKIIAAGYSHIGATEEFALARYNANGATANVKLNPGLNVYFSNITQPGTTVASVLTTDQTPALPNGYSLPANVSAYDIRTSAGYSGDIAVTFDVPNIADAATCATLRVLHYENGNWTAYRYGTPKFNAGTQVCTVSQTVTTLSPFVAAFEAPASFSFEADVQGRPIGDGFVDADDIQQIRSFVVGGGLPYQRNEFQRADCSPRSFFGDGFIDADDIQQARRFSIGTDNMQTASGPTAGSFAAPLDLSNALFDESGENLKFSTDEKFSKFSALRVGGQTTRNGQTVTVPVLVDTAGNETGYTFTLSYDAAKLTDPQIEIGTVGGDVVFNTATAGQIGVSVTSFKNEKIAPGANQVLLYMTFTTTANATGLTQINFTDTLAKRKAAGVDPNSLIPQPSYFNGSVTLTERRQKKRF